MQGTTHPQEFRALPKTAKEVNDQLLFEEQTLSCMLPVDASVSLSRSPDADQYDKYGVSIRVKFRDEAPLAELSAIHQSGGEARSVATVLYLMALQEQTTVPFRLVDEINQVEREYLQCRATVSRLEKEVAGSEHQLSLTRAEVAETGARWLHDVEELLQRVNASFGHFFCELGCVGEVSPSRSPDADQYDKYGVSIRVKFRDEAPLPELSAIHQSGGERSVATMLYLMALQEQTTVPFRVVDEINQVEREYLQCRATVSRLEKEVAGSEHQLSLTRAEVAETGARWLHDVEELLQRVNASFGHFFCELGCVGELLPDLPYSEDDTMIFLMLLDSPITEDIDVLAGAPVGLLRDT
ncbi:uncharacterized protein LOC144113260 isoform X2 [Amblyomma americanum]